MIHLIVDKKERKDNCIWLFKRAIIPVFGFLGFFIGMCRDAIFSQPKITPEEILIRGIIGLFVGLILGAILPIGIKILFSGIKFLIEFIKKYLKYNK